MMPHRWNDGLLTYLPLTLTLSPEDGGGGTRGGAEKPQNGRDRREWL